ncbi:MAG: lactate utilization protein C, partial [Chloroflexi bacterium]|nr:lactate utilization protein C [Chloroflexota bacterium]
EVGLTAAALAVAATGSVLVHSGPGRPLTASLLPRAHGVLVPASRLVPDLEAALRHPSWHSARAAALITGPSRTADIEMTLTVGVHGPAQVQVWLVTD